MKHAITSLGNWTSYLTTANNETYDAIIFGYVLHLPNIGNELQSSNCLETSLNHPSSIYMRSCSRIPSSASIQSSHLHLYLGELESILTHCSTPTSQLVLQNHSLFRLPSSPSALQSCHTLCSWLPYSNLPASPPCSRQP